MQYHLQGTLPAARSKWHDLINVVPLKARLTLFFSTIMQCITPPIPNNAISSAGTVQREFGRYSTPLAHLETGTCITTRVELDQLAIKCEYSKDFVMPGCEAYLRTGDRRNYISNAVFKDFGCYGCSKCAQSPQCIILSPTNVLGASHNV